MKILDFLKHAYQRIKYGYSYRDVWSIDMWFLEVVPKMLNDLAKNTYGAPQSFFNDDADESNEGFEKWRDTLKLIATKFTNAKEDTIKNEYVDTMHDIWQKRWRWKENKDGTHSLITDELTDEEKSLEEKYHHRESEIWEIRQNELKEGFSLFEK